MQVLASHLLFLANRNAGQAIPPLFWPVNCIKIWGRVALLSDPTVNCLYCVLTDLIAQLAEHWGSIPKDARFDFYRGQAYFPV